MMREWFAAKQRDDLHVFVAGIDATDVASIALHGSLGFRRCGPVREAGFTFGRWLDLELGQLLRDTPAEPVDG